MTLRSISVMPDGMRSRFHFSSMLTSQLSYAASVVMLLAYGVFPNGPNDPDIEAVNDCLYRLGITMRPGAWLVDYWPFLQYDPSRFI